MTTVSEKTDPDRTDEAAASEAIHGTRVGWVAGADSAGLLVDFEGNGHGPLPCRSTVALSAEALQLAVEQRQGAVLLFERGDATLPLLMGLLQPDSGTPNIDLILQSDPELAAEARVDGERVLVEGKEEIVLRCGEASITLRRDGKIVIKGTHLLSRSRWTNRIKGGSVQIN